MHQNPQAQCGDLFRAAQRRMGVWGKFRSIAAKLAYPNDSSMPSVTDFSQIAVSEVGNAETVYSLKEPVPSSIYSGGIGQILTSIRKFAVDSAVNISLKGRTGGKQIHELVQEKLDDQQRSLTLIDRKKKLEDCKSEVDQKHAKTQEMQEEFNSMKQEAMLLTKSSRETFEKRNEGSKGSASLTASRKKVFIRSRL